MKKLIQRWREDADTYMRQVEELRASKARELGRPLTPSDDPAPGMLAMATALRQCANDLEYAAP